MRSYSAAILILVLLIGMPVFAEENNTNIESKTWSNFEKGDGILALSLGTGISLGYYNPSGSEWQKSNTALGFAFSLSYTGFLNEHFALAGDLAGGFVSTVNDRRLFYAPLTVRAVYAIPFGSFIFMPSVGAGLAITSLSNYKHVDMAAKLGLQLFYRATSDMYYGINVFADYIPQIYQDSAQTRHGFFLDATLSVAYHL